MILSRCLLILASVLAGLPASAQQLVGQRLRGPDRTCVYANPNLVMRRLVPLVERRVGLGEPCPRHYTRPVESSTRPPAIPSLATLIRTERENDRMICTYEYRGQRYSRTVAVTQSCPYTPDFSY